MFITPKYLVTTYGIDETIARFFVNREPPAENLYWHQKLLYLRPSSGYLFIPLIIDLLSKAGLSKEELLSEQFVTTMEYIGHISALEEIKAIPAIEAIERCGEFTKAGVNARWNKMVYDYLKGGTENSLYQLTAPFQSLHRGDVFLFSLGMLEFHQSMFEKLADQWFALINILLLIDDAEDLESDSESGDMNTFLESGLHPEGMGRIADVANRSFEKIELLNQTMAEELRRQYAAHILSIV